MNELKDNTKLNPVQIYENLALQTENKEKLKPLILGYIYQNGIGVWNEKNILEFANICLALNLNPYNNDVFMVPYNTIKIINGVEKKVKDYRITINFKKVIEIAQKDPNYNGVEYERHFRNKNGEMLPLKDRYLIVKAYYKNGSKPYEKEFAMVEFLPKYIANTQGEIRPNYMLEKVATKLTLEQAFRAQQTLTPINLYTPEELVGVESAQLEENPKLLNEPINIGEEEPEETFNLDLQELEVQN